MTKAGLGSNQHASTAGAAHDLYRSGTGFHRQYNAAAARNEEGSR